MSLRLIEIVISIDDLPDLSAILREKAATRIWTEELASGIGRAKVLLPTERPESTLDLINQRYGGKEGFRAMLLPVEAAVPELTEEEGRPTERSGQAGKKVPAGPDRISRDELYQDIVEGTRLSRIFLITGALSTLAAARRRTCDKRGTPMIWLTFALPCCQTDAIRNVTHHQGG